MLLIKIKSEGGKKLSAQNYRCRSRPSSTHFKDYVLKVGKITVLSIEKVHLKHFWRVDKEEHYSIIKEHGPI